MHIAQTSKVRVKQGETVFVIDSPSPLQVSAEHAAIPAPPGCLVPGVLFLTSPFPDACFLPEGLRQKAVDAFEYSSVQGEQSNSKKAQLHVEVEELGNRLAFLVLSSSRFIWIRRDTQQQPVYNALCSLLGHVNF